MPVKLESVEKLNRKLKRQSVIARAERAKVDALLSSIGEGLIATDENGKIVQTNKVASELLGFTKKELLGNWYPSMIIAVYQDGRPVDPLERPATKVFLTGKTVTDTLFYIDKNGNMFPVQITASPVFLKDKPIGAIEIFRDVTKELEIDKQKSEFISLASHQLRTPLSSINLYSHMLKDGYAGKLNKNQQHLLDIVLSSTDRMNSLISTLLNITRVESNSIAVQRSPVNLSDLLIELLTTFEPRIKNKKVTLKSHINRNIKPINTDKLIVGEILSNLLSNSLKYTQDGGVIDVSMRKKGESILFSVEDNGYGIPANAQSYIFTKFFRASNILEHDVTGTGLGLYITKVLAEKISGDIWFKSKEGEGSSFNFSIPIAGNNSEQGRFNLESGIA